MQVLAPGSGSLIIWVWHYSDRGRVPFVPGAECWLGVLQCRPRYVEDLEEECIIELRVSLPSPLLPSALGFPRQRLLHPLERHGGGCCGSRA